MKTVSLMTFVTASLVAPVGCNPFSPDQTKILTASRLEAPATTSANAPFNVIVTVTTGGCVSFDRIEVQKISAVARLIPWGKDAAVGHRDISCPANVTDTPHTIQLDPPFSNPFQVVVEQGANPPLTATVQVQ